MVPKTVTLIVDCFFMIPIHWYNTITSTKVKGEWKYLYRAIDEQGKTLDYLSKRRNTKAAKLFLQKLIK